MKLYYFTPTQYLILSFVFGFAAGLLFGFFRLLRRAFRHGVLAVALEDLAFFALLAPLYWILCFGVALGRLRWFSFFGLVLGFLVYLASLGRLLSSLSEAIIAFFRKQLISLVRIAAVPARAVRGVFSRLFGRVWRSLRTRCSRFRRSRQLKRFLRSASRGFR